MTLQADRHCTDGVFQVGEQVLLKLQPYAQQSVVNRPYPKLVFKFFGPFTILARIDPAAYKLDLPEDSRIHNAFHVSQLKTFLPDSDISKLVDLSSVSTKPEAILDRRLVKKDCTPQVLIEWSKFPIAAATWEDLYVLKELFPAAAWGQVYADRCNRTGMNSFIIIRKETTNER